MTNRELIAHLLQFPMDAKVIYRCCSDYEGMDPEQVKLEKVTLHQHRHYKLFPDEWFPPGEQHVTVECITFPGN